MTTTVAQNLDNADVNYEIEIDGVMDGNDEISVELINDDGIVVESATGASGQLTVTNPRLWWPYLMNEDVGYMYELKVEIRGAIIAKDVYRLNVGIR